MNKIAKVSRAVRYLIILILLGHVSAFILAATSQNETQVYAIENAAGEPVLSKTISVSPSWQAFADALQAEGLNSYLWLTGPELIFYFLIYWWLFNLFGRYQQGDIFSAGSTRLIRNIGTCLLVWPLFSVLYPVLLTLLLESHWVS